MKNPAAAVDKAFLSAVKKYKLVSPGEKICVAVSGGADSMLLLHLFCKYAKDMGIELCAANVEHGIRGEASLADSAFVTGFCADAGIKLYTASFDVPAEAKKAGVSEETAARNLRKKFFRSLLDEKKADKIALAHHADDNAETILMNIFRGAGLKGAAGMDYISDNFIRPMLEIEKKDILTCCEAENIPYVIDETNYDSAYTRNFIRNEVLPLIQTKYPCAVKSINRFSRSAREYIPDVSPVYELRDDSSAVIPLNELKEHAYFKLKDALSALGVYTDFSEKHFNAVMDTVSSQSGKSVCICHNITAVKTFDNLLLVKNDAACKNFAGTAEDIPYRLNETAEGIEINGYRIKFIPADRNSGMDFGRFRYLDADKIPENAVWRQRKAGDRFTPCNGKSKSLKKWLIEKKIPADKRNIPLLAAGEEILAVGDMEISDAVKTDGLSENIYKLDMTPRRNR